MKVLQVFMHNPLRNFNYIVYSEVNNKAIFIDPLDIDKTLELARELSLEPTWLLNTHGHHDHIRGNKPFLEATGATHLKLEDGERFELSPTEAIKCLYTPGHTKDHYCFILETDGKEHALISGDTLFNAGVGNCKNGGNLEELYESVQHKLLPLDENLELYPGHDYLLNNLKFALTVEEDNADVKGMIAKREKQNLDEEFVVTTLAQEKRINPFLRLEKLQSKFKDREPKEIFFELRSLRDKW